MAYLRKQDAYAVTPIPGMVLLGYQHAEEKRL